ncbi:hypothetical protein BV25DRAFT_1986672, partial [Artomyces pyxidatus]
MVSSNLTSNRLLTTPACVASTLPARFSSSTVMRRNLVLTHFDCLISMRGLFVFQIQSRRPELYSKWASQEPMVPVLCMNPWDWSEIVVGARLHLHTARLLLTCPEIIYRRLHDMFDRYGPVPRRLLEHLSDPDCLQVAVTKAIDTDGIDFGVLASSMKCPRKDDLHTRDISPLLVLIRRQKDSEDSLVETSLVRPVSEYIHYAIQRKPEDNW